MIPLEVALDVNIASIITAIGAIVVGWFSYNQYTKNKKTDLELKEIKADKNQLISKRSAAYATIYGKLWRQLITLDCDRVSIIQPHPLNRAQFLSVSLEVRRDGITGLKESIHSIEMEDVPQFTSDLESRDYIFYKNLKTDAKDKIVIAKFSAAGCVSIGIKRMVNEDEAWNGNLFCEWCRPKESLFAGYIRSQMAETAQDIQYILPEYVETLNNA